MVWNTYFELQWDYVSETESWTTKRFRMQMDGANPFGLLNLSGYQTNLDGELVVTRVTFRPHSVNGMVVIHEGATGDWGTISDLTAAAAADDLQAKMYNDNAFWEAEWTGDFQPIPLDPLGNNWLIPLELRQRNA